MPRGCFDAPSMISRPPGAKLDNNIGLGGGRHRSCTDEMVALRIAASLQHRRSASTNSVTMKA